MKYSMLFLFSTVLATGCEKVADSRPSLFGLLNRPTRTFVTPTQPTYGATYFGTYDGGYDRYDHEKYFRKKAQDAAAQNQRARFDPIGQVAGAGIYFAPSPYDLYRKYGDQLAIFEFGGNIPVAEIDSSLAERVKKGNTLSTIQLSVPIVSYLFSQSLVESTRDPGTPYMQAGVVRDVGAINWDQSQYYDTTGRLSKRTDVPLVADAQDIFDAMAKQVAAGFDVFADLAAIFAKSKGYFTPIAMTDANIFALLQVSSRYADNISQLYGGDQALSDALRANNANLEIPYHSDLAPPAEVVQALKRLGLIGVGQEAASMKDLADMAVTRLRNDHPEVVAALASHIASVNYTMNIFSSGQGMSTWGVDAGKSQQDDKQKALGQADRGGDASETGGWSDNTGEASGNSRRAAGR